MNLILSEISTPLVSQGRLVIAISFSHPTE